MKRLGILLLVVSLLMSLVACGTEETAEEPKEEPEVVEEVKEEPEEVVEEEPEDVVEEEPEEMVEEPEVEEMSVEEEDDNGLTEEEVEYLSTMTVLFDEFSQVLLDFSDQNMKVAEDPSVMFTNEWVTEMAGILANMGILADEIYAIEPPERFKEVHDIYLQAMDEIYFIYDTYPEAIDNLDVDLLEQCVIAMENVSALIQEGTNKLLSTAGM